MCCLEVLVRNRKEVKGKKPRNKSILERSVVGRELSIVAKSRKGKDKLQQKEGHQVPPCAFAHAFVIRTRFSSKSIRFA